MKHFLEGDTVYLRPLVLQDADGDYVNWLNDAIVCAYNSHGAIKYDKEQAIKYITDLNWKSDCLVLAIVAKENDLHIGNISLQKIDSVSRNAEYAVMVGNTEYWGKGVSREASVLIIQHGFIALDLHRIYCGTSSKNIPMQRLALSLGMNEEGRRKEAFCKNGEFVDIVEYGILKKDFILNI